LQHPIQSCQPPHFLNTSLQCQPPGNRLLPPHWPSFVHHSDFKFQAINEGQWGENSTYNVFNNARFKLKVAINWSLIRTSAKGKVVSFKQKNGKWKRRRTSISISVGGSLYDNNCSLLYQFTSPFPSSGYKKRKSLKVVKRDLYPIKYKTFSGQVVSVFTTPDPSVAAGLGVQLTMTICNILKRGILFLLISFCLHSRAQVTAFNLGEVHGTLNQDILDLMYSHSHLGIGGYLTLCEKANVTKTSGNYKMGASPQLGFGLQINYSYNINTKWSLVSGIYGNACGWNYLLTIPGKDIDSSLHEDYVDNGAASRDKNLFYITLPLEVQKRWWTKNLLTCLFANLGAGLNWSFSRDDNFTEQIFLPGREPIQVLQMNLSLNNKGKPWISLQGGAGCDWVLSNMNMISVNLNFCLSFSKVADGTYQITVPGQPVTMGNYSVTTTHIGLGLNYIFTRTKKKLKSLQTQ